MKHSALTAPPANRRWELDALRGLMLVLMALTHFPTRLSDALGQPFGFVSAAEGFVVLSAYMAGMVYAARAQRDGAVAMRSAFVRRALKIYACQAALLLFAFTVIAGIGVLLRQDAVTNLLGFYIARPLAGLLNGLLLVYSPALLDILPLYIILMLASPVLLLHGLRHGWLGLMAASVLLWLAAQFDLGRAFYDQLSRWVTLPVSHRDMGAFEVFGWQFVWMLGLWMGAAAAGPRGAVRPAFPRWMVAAALVIAGVGLVWRQAIGQVPFPGQPGLNLLFDKWHLGPLRLINFLALLVLVLHFGPWLKRHVPRLPALELLGQQALPVFCAHLVVALTALALLGTPQPTWAWQVDAGVLGTGFLVLLLVAAAGRALDWWRARRPGPRGFSVLADAGAPRSPLSTAHTPSR